MSTFFTVVGFFVLLLVGGVGIGIGIALGLEIVMRISGDGRTVLLTFARTKTQEPRSMTDEHNAQVEPCGGCGETNPLKRCIGCGHDFGDETSAWVRAALSSAPVPPSAADGKAEPVNEYREVLSGLSSYLGAGMGDDDTSADAFDKRIRWGIDNHVSSVFKMCAATVERLSKKPTTTWGEVKAEFEQLANDSASPPARHSDEEVERLRAAFEHAAKIAEEDRTPGYGPHRDAMEHLAESQRTEIARRIREAGARAALQRDAQGGGDDAGTS